MMNPRPLLKCRSSLNKVIRGHMHYHDPKLDHKCETNLNVPLNNPYPVVNVDFDITVHSGACVVCFNCFHS